MNKHNKSTNIRKSPFHHPYSFSTRNEYKHEQTTQPPYHSLYPLFINHDGAPTD
ncbi:hypothetical protein MTR_5g033460 [Medicago truncatula]|uniref:Uncharacterized protein n=1 Tax=Medicago truncatula TaxID=3880 RepID=G7JZ10_MEDTR|nr:hypothetical protein MTR_5g033460 [Medicago truncatula]